MKHPASNAASPAAHRTTSQAAGHSATHPDTSAASAPGRTPGRASGRPRGKRPRVPLGLAPIEPGLLLTKGEAAKLLGLGESTVERWCLNGTLPSVKLGAFRRIPRHALDRWIEQRTHDEAEQARLRRGEG